MALDQETRDLITGFDEATTAVATRIDGLLAQIQAGMSAADVAELKAAFAPELARLRGLGSNPAEPIPAEP